MTTLNKLLHQIHAIKNKAEMQSSLLQFKTKIRDIVTSGGFEEENYFINHTGRELFRKLYNFNLTSEIKDDHDPGFRLISLKKFNPLSVNTLAWYDASDQASVTQSEIGITKWLDKGYFKNDLTPKNETGTNAHAVEKKSLNGKDTIKINENDYFEKKNVNLLTPSGDLQVFIVAKPTVISHASDSLVSINENTMSESTVDFQLDSARNNQCRPRLNVTNAVGGNTNTNTGVGPNTTNEWHIFSVIFDYSKEKTFHVYIDGAEVGASKSYTNKMAGGNSQPPTDLRVFANRFVSHFLEGSIAEILFCENSSNENREKIEGYLAHKWGLTSELESGHPYKNYLYKFFNF